MTCAEADSGTFTLPPPYNWVGRVNINDKGVVVGEALVFDPVAGGFVDTVGFRRSRRGRVRILPQPPGAARYAAQGINDKGVIAGVFFDSSQGRARGVLWKRRDPPVVFDLDAPPSSTVLSDINAWGSLAGYFVPPGAAPRGYFDVGQGPELFDVPGALVTLGNGIDELGRVVGSYVPSGGGPSRGFVKTLFFGIKNVFFPGRTDTVAFDINTAGTIVGTIERFSFGFIARPRLCAKPGP